MTIKIEKNKRYVVPQKRMKEIERLHEEMLAERAMINAMTDEEYEAYEREQSLRDSEEDIENEEFYTHEEVMEELWIELEKDEKERKNYEKWKLITQRMRTYAV